MGDLKKCEKHFFATFFQVSWDGAFYGRKRFAGMSPVLWKLQMRVFLNGGGQETPKSKSAEKWPKINRYDRNFSICLGKIKIVLYWDKRFLMV